LLPLDSALSGDERQLALIREVSRAAATLQVPFWLRGGWAMDFFIGRITR